MNTLYIDTTSNTEITLCLTIDKTEYRVTKKLEKQKAQVALPLIEQILREQRLSFQNIHAITVNAGPGSFTGVRVGIAIANTFGFLLKIPINGKKIGEMAEAIYA